MPICRASRDLTRPASGSFAMITKWQRKGAALLDGALADLLPRAVARAPRSLTSGSNWIERVAAAILFDFTRTWHPKMVARNGDAVGHDSVVDLATGRLRHLSILVECRMPSRVPHEKCRQVGDITQHHQLFVAGTDQIAG